MLKLALNTIPSRFLTVFIVGFAILALASCEKKNKQAEENALRSECRKPSSGGSATGYEHITPPEMEGIVWETNLEDAPLASPDALRCGTYRDYISSFPLTFRLYGPESNSGDFVSYKRAYSMLSFVTRHPVTFNYVPELATHWALKDDGRTAYFHLDPDARWSDGQPIKAEDYVYSMEFFTSDHLKAPFYKQYYNDTYESIEKISDSVVKVVLNKPSWRLLEEANISPVPKHDTQLDEKWMETYQWKMPVVPGAYVLDSFDRGKSVTFKRTNDWWGDKKLYMKNMFNFDEIKLNVVLEKKLAFLMFQKGELDMFSPDPSQWARESDFAEVKNGYILKRKLRKRVFNGAFGIFFNAQDSVWKDKLLRQAFSHVFDFDKVNEQFMFSLYDRRQKFFMSLEPYSFESLRAYPYDLEKAEELLEKAGWARKEGSPFRSKNGKVLELTLNYGGDAYDQQLPLLKETALKVGIDLVLKKLDPSALYKTWGDKSYAATILGFGGGFYPSPRQFFHTENINKNSNNINMYGSEEMDKLIQTFEEDLSEEKRVAAIRRIEEIINDEAVLLPFWINPYVLSMYWRHIKGPKEFITKTGLSINYLWYDDLEAAKVLEAQKSNEKMDMPPVEGDPYNLASQ